MGVWLSHAAQSSIVSAVAPTTRDIPSNRFGLLIVLILQRLAARETSFGGDEILTSFGRGTWAALAALVWSGFSNRPKNRSRIGKSTVTGILKSYG
jgi:hypothetical protein